jgi:hypothetical protein
MSKPERAKVGELRPAEEARVAVVDAGRDHIHRRGHVESVQHGRRVPENVAIPVVEGDHHGPRRQYGSVLERIEEL